MPPYARRRQYDRLFFSGLGALILVAVWTGFAPTYYLAGLFRAPLPGLLVHIHGAVFSAWILLFIVQITLVATGRLDWHRSLGMFGFLLAGLLVVFGVIIAVENLGNYGEPAPGGEGKRTFFAVTLSDIVMFATLIFFAYRNRFNAATHKRLVLIATLSILDAAYDRWPIPVTWWDDRVSPMFCTYPVLLGLLAYDWWSTRKIQPATLWGSLFLIVVTQGRDRFGRTDLWQSFASWVYVHAHAAPFLRHPI